MNHTRETTQSAERNETDQLGNIKEEHSGDSGVLRSVRETAHHVAAGASAMAGRVQDTAEVWAENATEMAGTAKDAVCDTAGAVAQRAEEFGATVTKMIRQYPLQALLVGFGVGFLIGQMRPRS